MPLQTAARVEVNFNAAGNTNALASLQSILNLVINTGDSQIGPVRKALTSAEAAASTALVFPEAMVTALTSDIVVAAFGIYNPGPTALILKAKNNAGNNNVIFGLAAGGLLLQFGNTIHAGPTGTIIAATMDPRTLIVGCDPAAAVAVTYEAFLIWSKP